MVSNLFTLGTGDHSDVCNIVNRHNYGYRGNTNSIVL